MSIETIPESESPLQHLPVTHRFAEIARQIAGAKGVWFSWTSAQGISSEAWSGEALEISKKVDFSVPTLSAESNSMHRVWKIGEGTWCAEINGPFHCRMILNTPASDLEKAKAEALFERCATSFTEQVILWEQSGLERMMLIGMAAAELAHEVLNPLTITMTHLQIIRELLDQGGLESADLLKSRFERVERSLDRTLRLVRAVKSLSAGRTTPRFQAFQLSPILDDALELVRARCKTEDIVIRPSSGNTKCWINGDPLLITQAILNLMNNATDAAHEAEGDHRWISIDVEVRGSKIAIQVRDGAASMGRVAPELGVRPLATQKPMGSGIGLQLAKRIAKIHGSAIIWRIERTGHSECTLFEFELDAASSPS